MDNLQETILVAMSGGVDSSAAALLLKEAGWHVKGLIFRMHDEGMTAEDLANGKLPQSIWYAREAARRMRLDFTLVDARGEFRQEVIDLFLSGCAAQSCPDPCVYCDPCFKFPRLFEEAEKKDCTKIATGHYAVTAYDPDRGRYVIRKSAEAAGDQSHRLYRLSQEQLSRLVTPLGGHTKEEIRSLAAKARLKNAFAPESPEICFLDPQTPHPFEKEQLPAGAVEAARDPMSAPSFRRNHVRAGSLHYAGLEALPEKGLHLRARIRSARNESDCFVRIINGELLDIRLEQELSAAAPGQSIVLYDKDTVALGGIIVKE